MLKRSNPFQSFWMAGYECADHLNAFGIRSDLTADTQHLEKIDEDFRNLSLFGIRTVREGVQWSMAEKTAYQYDFSNAEIIIKAARRHRIQVVWDLCHFGYPDDLTPLHPMFARRFSSLCRAFVEFYRRWDPEGELVITPINEVNFVSWLGGDVRGTVPYCIDSGWDVKVSLMKAYIEGVETLLETDPRIRIMTTEPLVHITAFNECEIERQSALLAHENQYQVLDILSGRLCPELRGKEEYLDIIGLNFYFNNQWDHQTRASLPWNDMPPHPLWKPLSELVSEVHTRYGRPMVISETSHPLEDRPVWIEKIGEQLLQIKQANLPLWGTCIYPIIDRPDWDFGHWHYAGVWDVDPSTKQRILYEPYADALIRTMALVDQ